MLSAGCRSWEKRGAYLESMVADREQRENLLSANSGLVRQTINWERKAQGGSRDIYSSGFPWEIVDVVVEDDVAFLELSMMCDTSRLCCFHVMVDYRHQFPMLGFRGLGDGSDPLKLIVHH